MCPVLPLQPHPVPSGPDGTMDTETVVVPQPDGQNRTRWWKRGGKQIHPVLFQMLVSFVGIVGIPLKDAKELKITLKKTSKRIKSFLKFAEDSAGVSGIPELVLHPLTKRPSSDVIVKDTDTLENNYKLLCIVV